MRKTILVGTTISLLALAAPAGAQATSDKAAAEALFREAGKLFQAGKYTEACPKLAASQKLDPAVGTLMNLGRCYEKTGQTASAWATYSEAADAARAAGQADREKAARKAAEATEPKLARLLVATKEPGVDVRRDGTALPSASWGGATPVDPGEHVIEASAPGKKTWSAKVTAEAGKTVNVDIPALEAVPVEAAPPVAAAPQATAPSTSVSPAAPSGRRTTALVLAGAGVLGIGIGSVFGLGAMSSNSDSKGYCNGSNQCTPQGGDARDSAKSKATISTIAFGLGIVALATGGVLYFTAPKGDKSPGITVALPIGSEPAAVTWKGAW
jgi:serine/threonine-protein kinase